MDGIHYSARAPLRIGLAGGGTDVDPYATEKGGVVFNATINKYTYCTLIPRADGKRTARSSFYGNFRADLANGPFVLDGNLDIVNVVADHFGIDSGFDAIMQSEVPPGSGLGGSSTVMVSIISAFSEWTGHRISAKDMAKLAFDLERKKLGLKGGRQDQYAAVFGGFNLMKFNGDNAEIERVCVGKDVVDELQARTLLCYTGATRSSGDIIDSQMKAFVKGDNEKALDESKRIASEMANAIGRGEITLAGKLLRESWQFKKQFSNKISNSTIDSMYESALKAGAIGGKVSGAGGGGFMFFICDYDRKYKVAEALQDANEKAIVTDFMFEPHGATSWRYPNE